MTRREEIERQAEITVFPWDEPQEQNKFQDGFIEGAKWADKTMIEKACSILEDMTEGRLGKGFINEFKNKLTYGVLERH